MFTELFRRHRFIASVGCAACLLASQASAVGAPLRYEGQPGSKVRIEGTSTIHDWTAESQIIAGYIEFDPSFATDPTLKASATPPKVEVSIPVRSLKSSGKKAMDSVMHDAMKQQTHPKIEYKLLSMTAKDGASGGSVPFDTKGALTIAGITRTNDMVVRMEKVDDKTLKFSTTVGLKMTDYGIKPPAPTIGLGLIKTADDVKLNIEWVTAPAAAPAKP